MALVARLPRPEVSAFVAIVVADTFGLVPLTQAILLLPLVWLSLRLGGAAWPTIGFNMPHEVPNTLAFFLIYPDRYPGSG